MKSYTDISAKYFESEAAPDLERFIDINVSIATQILEYLQEEGWSQKDFAQKLDKSEAEISKWLSGLHNLTLKSIAKMETALGRDIILTHQEAVKKYRPINSLSKETAS